MKCYSSVTFCIKTLSCQCHVGCSEKNEMIETRLVQSLFGMQWNYNPKAKTLEMQGLYPKACMFKAEVLYSQR